MRQVFQPHAHVYFIPFQGKHTPERNLKTSRKANEPHEQLVTPSSETEDAEEPESTLVISYV